MLTTLTTGFRFRLAIMLALFATLCFAAPPAVLAFGHGEATVDCLAHADMVDHGRDAAGDMKHHGDHFSPPGNHQPGCCGLFCMSALATVGGEIVTPVAAGALHTPAPGTILFSRVPERPDRPPIFLLVV
jgi:hypothetical protein